MYESLVIVDFVVCVMRSQVMLGLVVAAYAIGYFHTGTLLGMGEISSQQTYNLQLFDTCFSFLFFPPTFVHLLIIES